MSENKDAQPDTKATEMVGSSSTTAIPETGNTSGEWETCKCKSCQHNTQTPDATEASEGREEFKFPEITNISTWSELAKYLTAYHPTAFADAEKEFFIDVNLTCDICCLKRLRLPDWIDSTAYLTEDRDSEDICVLPCGHFFGYKCIHRWVDQKKHEADGFPDCPKCRFPLIYPECEHPIYLRALRDLNDFDPEDIGYLMPNTHVYKLSADGKTFIDISERRAEYFAQFDPENNFGVPDNCFCCAKRNLIMSWERQRQNNPLW